MVLSRQLLPGLLLAGLVSGEVLAFEPDGLRQVRYAPAYAYYPRPPQWGGFRPASHGYPYQSYRQPPLHQQAAVASSRPVVQPQNTARGLEITKQAVVQDEEPEQSEPSAPSVLDENQSSDHKTRFIENLVPLVQQENERILMLRSEVARLLEKIETKQGMTEREVSRLLTLAKHYRIEGNPLDKAEARAKLLKRIDIIPVSLAVAQAATESAWGKSRFAREANNLFGIWTYDEDKGVVPERRAEGKTHLVRKFDSRGESVRYYLHNLNSHPAYKALRTIREEQRHKGEQPDGMDLAEGLERYSAKGRKYIKLIRQVIRHNSLAQLDRQSNRA